VAFGIPGVDDRYASLKTRACAEVGIEVVQVLVPPTATTTGAVRRTLDLVESGCIDALFLQFPFPDGVDRAALIEAVPEELDVDAMTEGRTRRYHGSITEPPPLTVAACLALLGDFGLDVHGLHGVLVCEPSPFAEVFKEALSRRGTSMALVPPGTVPSEPLVREAGLVVVAAASPGLVQSKDLAPGAVVIDAGYFNPGGIGDVDTTGGVDHLLALGPVPGGIGPMVISKLIDRVIEFAIDS
jgi:methylenetetrahydrofolate dehydrogenase (NADP+)/methenyltetrahydrofolate cyclohydrolase